MDSYAGRGGLSFAFAFLTLQTHNSPFIIPNYASPCYNKTIIPKKYMNILVTGGAGFIGSHIVDQLIARGHQVIMIDNLVTGQTDQYQPNL